MNKNCLNDNDLIIKDQRINCIEAFFKVSLIVKDEYNIDNIGEVCYDSIKKYDIYIRKDRYNSFFLFGGTSMFNGLEVKLTK